MFVDYVLPFSQKRFIIEGRSTRVCFVGVSMSKVARDSNKTIREESLTYNLHSLCYSSSYKISYWRWQRVEQLKVSRRLHWYPKVGGDGSSSSRLWWSISSWMGQFISSLSSPVDRFFSRLTRIIFSMGDIFLEPMMKRFNSTEGPVSATWGILSAITLLTGGDLLFFSLSVWMKRSFYLHRTDCHDLHQLLRLSKGDDSWRFSRCFGISRQLFCPLYLGLLYHYWYRWRYFFNTELIFTSASPSRCVFVLGLGFGLMYLPAITSVGFYFEKKRSFAMGIAVCGSGLGTLVLPWVMPYAINGPLRFNFSGALLIEAGIIFTCVIFGALMVKPSTWVFEIDAIVFLFRFLYHKSPVNFDVRRENPSRKRKRMAYQQVLCSWLMNSKVGRYLMKRSELISHSPFSNHWNLLSER